MFSVDVEHFCASGERDVSEFEERAPSRNNLNSLPQHLLSTLKRSGTAPL